MNATLRLLAARPRRTLLAVAGIAVGAAAYVLLVGSARGFLRQFNGLAVVFGADVVVAQAGATSPWNSALPEERIAEVRAAAPAAAVSRVALGKARIVGAPFFLAFGLDPEEPLLARTPLQAGRRPRPGSGEMLLGTLAAARLHAGVGSTIDVRGRQLAVVGVHRSGHRVLDSGGIVTLDDARALFNLPGSVSLGLVHVSGGETPGAAAERIRARVPGVEATTAADWVESYGQLAVVEDFARFLALLALVVSSLGISNVLHVSVSERTAELALLRAVGWSRARVAGHVLAEAALLSLAGGALALPLAEAVLFLVGTGRVGSLETAGFLPPHVAPVLLLEGAAVALVAGTFGALGPVRHALRVPPAAALRGA